MAGTMSGGITMQGLGSGTDFSEMITKLKQYESIPKMRMEIWRAEWMTRIDAFNAITSKMAELKSTLASFNTMDKMLAREVNSSKSEYATATANSKIDEGVYTIEVDQLARAALYSSKKVYNGKSDKVNETGSTQTFSYSYKGATRTLDIPDGYTLEQMVNKINQDARNPGVKASIMRNGSGYIFQIQGKETGLNSTLNIESSLADFDAAPHFSSSDVPLTDTGGTFKYEYGGKVHSVAVTAGMTMNQLVDAINAQAASTGLSADIKMENSNASIQFKDHRTGVNMSYVTTSSDVESLGAQKAWTSGSDVVNNTGETQAFTYKIGSESYTINITAGATRQDVEDAINRKLGRLDIPPAPRPDKLKANFTSGELEFTSEDAVLTANDSNPMIYKYMDRQGNEREMAVEAGTTFHEFVSQLKRHLPADMDVEIDDTLSPNMGLTFLEKGTTNDITATTTTANNITGLDGGGTVAIGTMNRDFTTNTEIIGLGGREPLSGKDLKVNESGATQTLSIDVNGTIYQYPVPDGTTLAQLESGFNSHAALQSPPWDLRMKVVQTGSGYELQYTDAADNKITPTNINHNGMDKLRGAADNYNGRQAQNARFKLNGWDQVFESETNRLTEVIDGLDITLKGEGKTDLTVTNDKEALKDNIQEVVDSINGLMAQITELTKYDPDKEVKSPEVDDETGLLKMMSQFTWQKGAVLTGNYGVQLLRTRLRYLNTNTAKGFVKQADDTDKFNDMFTSLASIGITTNSKESDDSFGMLIIDEKKLDEAIEKDIRGVAELFSADREPKTDSTEFSIVEPGLQSKPGNYEVTYEVGPDGKPMNVIINGVSASPSEGGLRWTVGDFSNDAKGLAIQFTEADLGPAGTTYKNSVRLKDGKVNEYIRQLEEELQPVLTDQSVEDIALNGYSAGAIPSLISNYQNIVKNIDKKITRETERLATWEKRQKAKYARLDTLLSEYYNQMSKNESSLAQLGSK